MQVKIYEEPILDQKWDEFLEGEFNGHHVQSSLWGQLKTKFGMKVFRIIVEDDGSIIGGAQILSRPLPIFGNIGYISRGPIAASGREEVVELIFDKIEELARERNLLVLSIEPPTNEELYMKQLRERDFRFSNFYIIPPTTVLVDLHQHQDAILAQMRSKTRYNIRYALRDDIEIKVRDGSEDDLPLLYSWMEAAAKRDSYYYSTLDYYQEAWHQFEPSGNLKLFMAYYQDQPIAGIIVIAFGDWAVYKWGASSGEHLNAKPNQLLHWHAIQWSQGIGCRYYDLGGITPVVAEAIKNGEKLPQIKGAGIARFKLGFGERFDFPYAYDNNYGPFPRWMIRNLVAFIWKFDFLRDFIRKVVNPG